MGEGITKKLLRKQAIDLRRLYVASKSVDDLKYDNEKLFQNLQELIMDFKGSPIATYIPMRGEFDISYTNSFLHQKGYILCLPKVIEQHQMSFHEYKPEQELSKSSFGFKEPSADSKQLIPKTYLVPMVAFDETCHRLGYGQGHYDREIHQARQLEDILVIGIAFDMQKVDKIPIDTYDQQMDYVVTEKQVYKAKK